MTATTRAEKVTEVHVDAAARASRFTFTDGSTTDVPGACLP